jgi:hypothetical protein
MRKKTAKKARNEKLLASVKKQMAEPRMAMSARDEVATLATANKTRWKRPLRPVAAD